MRNTTEGARDEINPRGRQIIITTHHPEIVKYAGPEYVILLQRDKKGHSVFSRPRENEEIQAFLEEMGIEDLYVQNLLS